MWRGPGWRNWVPGCTRGIHRHAGPALPESGDKKFRRFGEVLFGSAVIGSFMSEINQQHPDKSSSSSNGFSASLFH